MNAVKGSIVYSVWIEYPTNLVLHGLYARYSDAIEEADRLNNGDLFKREGYEAFVEDWEVK